MEQQYCNICNISVTKKNFSRHAKTLDHIHNMLRKKKAGSENTEEQTNNIPGKIQRKD